jgi:hypothetical protein
MEKTQNNKAWFMVLPGLADGGVLGGHPADDGRQLFDERHVRQQRLLLERHLGWYEDMILRLRSLLHDAMGRQPNLLGDHSRDRDPARHFHRAQHAALRLGQPTCLVLMALPLFIPWNVVGTIWQVFGRVDIGLLGHTVWRRHRLRLQLRQRSIGRLDHHHRADGRLALDERSSCCSATPGLVNRSRTLITKPPALTAPRRWSRVSLYPAAEDESRAC